MLPLREDQQALLRQLEGFEVDRPGAELPFSARLAREQGWTHAYATRAIREYKRFVFLCATEPQPVCPSEQVDAVWHLHLTYTRSYWEELCQQVLGRPLHHDPTSGGTEQLEYHWEMYERTLNRYAQVFVEAPPADLWPPADVRFDARIRRQVVDLSRWWMLPRPRWLRTTPRLLSESSRWHASLSALPLLLGAVNPFNLKGPEFLNFLAVLAALAAVIWFVLQYVLRASSTTVSPEGLLPEEVGYLNSGEEGALGASLAELVRQETVSITQSDSGAALLSLGSQHYSGRARLPKAIVSTIRQQPATVSNLHKACQQELDDLEQDLVTRGLLLQPGIARVLRWLPTLLLAGLTVVASIKLCVGVVRSRPVGFLVLIELMLLGALWLAYLSVGPRRTLAGDAVLRQLRAQLKAARRKASSSQADDRGAQLEPALAGMMVGVFGLTALPVLFPATLGTDFQRHFHPTAEGSAGSSGSGCTASACGGGGCGGGGCGGGGCGGCS